MLGAERWSPGSFTSGFLLGCRILEKRGDVLTRSQENAPMPFIGAARGNSSTAATRTFDDGQTPGRTWPSGRIVAVNCRRFDKGRVARLRTAGHLLERQKGQKDLGRSTYFCAASRLQSATRGENSRDPYVAARFALNEQNLLDRLSGLTGKEMTFTLLVGPKHFEIPYEANLVVVVKIRLHFNAATSVTLLPAWQ